MKFDENRSSSEDIAFTPGEGRRSELQLEIRHRGQVVVLHCKGRMRGQSAGRTIKFADPSQRVRHLFKITNLVSILDLYPSLEVALDASSRELSRCYKGCRKLVRITPFHFNAPVQSGSGPSAPWLALPRRLETREPHGTSSPSCDIPGAACVADAALVQEYEPVRLVPVRSPR